MNLYGTVTSPYVRRVRIIAELVGAPVELIDTSTDAGQASLRLVTPLWKIPVLETPEGVIFDSTVICRYLLRRYGDKSLRNGTPDGEFFETNLVSAIDGALDARINVLYLARDGVKPSEVGYVQKQLDRVEAVMGWLASKLDGGYFTREKKLGWSEIALATTLDWMRFRKVYDTSQHAALDAFSKVHQDVPALVNTLPPAA